MSSKITVAELLISIGVDAKDATKAAKKLEDSLEGVEDAAEGVGDATDKSEKSLKRWESAAKGADKVASVLTKILVAATTAVVGIGTAVIRTGSEFETLSARLKTVTGSSEAAERALSFVKEFASKTPFQVTEITDAFIKLRNLGIKPTEERLTAFGNIAAGNSKSLDQFTEAVLDASSGEFERLKEFGIRAKQSGDQVALTFRGQTTSIANNAESLTNFLTEIGENDFAGAMAERMMTLDGVISNAKDQLTNFLLEVAQDGPLQEFKGLIDDLTKGAGDKEGLAKVLARTLTNAIRAVRRVLEGDLIETLKKAAKALEFVIDNWKIFVGLIAGAKAISAFGAAAKGFQAIGIAANSALGPIGAIAAAFIALIPIANAAGRAIGTAIAKRNQLREPPRTKKAGASKVFGALSTADRSALASKDQDVAAAQGLVDSKDKELRQRGLHTKADANIANRNRLVAERETLNNAASGRASVAAAAASAAAEAEADAAAEQAAFEKEQEEGLAAIEFGPEFIPEAFKGKTGRGGGGRKKKKPKKKRTSPTTVSEFFRAASGGELGAIAARTPSTKDIEPTVAVDITNITNNVTNKFDIKSNQAGPQLGKDIATQIEKTLGRQRAIAGQALASNVVR